MKQKQLYIFTLLQTLLLLLTGCRKDEIIFLSDSEQVSLPVVGLPVKGFYLLNEGNMGMNRATIDYFDYATGIYTRDLYSERNPEIVKELGDVGNDLKVYGSRVYAVINCSNYIEVIDAASARHIGSVQIPNCRYLAFNGGKAYVSSYAGPVGISPNAEAGFVAEIDTASLQILRKVTVGYQPEEMVISHNRLYVANSGGYRIPNYDTRVSVIDLDSFTKIKDIDVAINLHRMEVDTRGDIYVSSRGNKTGISSNLYVIAGNDDSQIRPLNIPVSEMTLCGDSLYFLSSYIDYATGINKTSYGILDTRTKEVVTDRLITDGSEQQILIPYGLAVNPFSREFYITDGQNYVVTGYIYCFSPDGRLRWKTQAGNIPAHFAFVK